jgi:transcriptional regulator with XRE-family HTH domain
MHKIILGVVNINLGAYPAALPGMPHGLGRRLLGLRKAKGLSLQELSALSGVDVGQISRYEQAKATPSSDSLLALARALDVSSAYLTGEARDLAALKPTVVAKRESQRMFFSRSSLTEAEQNRFRAVVDFPAAPATRRGWQQLNDLIRRYVAESV